MKHLPSLLLLIQNATLASELSEPLAQEYDVHLANSNEDAFCILEQQWVQLLLLDSYFLECKPALIEQIKSKWPDIIIILVLPYASAQLIEQADKQGIMHIISCPQNASQLCLIMRGAQELFAVNRENKQLKFELKLRPKKLQQEQIEQRKLLDARANWDYGIIRSNQSSMNQVCETIQHVAPFDVNVVLMGESGTGKELCAQAIHFNSLRQGGEFVVQNCGALPDELLESELFGHKRGAFTGAIADKLGLFDLADGGTLFLDEVGELSAAFQVKLLRVLQEGEVRPLGDNQAHRVDVRVVAATNKDLEEEVSAGRFRQDLFYRLATFVIQLPALRERKMDVPLLAQGLLDDVMLVLGKKIRGITPQTLSHLQAYQWPGNVRELQNEIKRMLVMSHSDYLTADLLSAKILLESSNEPIELFDSTLEINTSLKNRVQVLEERIIKETLIRNRWNKSRSAQELGLSRVGLSNKLARYDIVQQNQV